MTTKDDIIYMGRYEFRDEVLEEVKALEIKQTLLDVKKNKLEQILHDIDPLWNDKVKVEYLHNTTTDEYLFNVVK